MKDQLKKISDSIGKNIKNLMSGRIFTSANVQKNFKYILFVFVLAVVYIGYRYTIEKTIITNKALNKEVKLLHSEYVTKKIELMNISTRSEIIKKIEEKKLTIKEPQNPPIRVDAKIKNDY